jgi:hypothetical protein
MKLFLSVFFSIYLLNCNAQTWGLGTQWLYKQDVYMPQDFNPFLLLEIVSDSIDGSNTFYKLQETIIKKKGKVITQTLSQYFLISKNGNKVKVLHEQNKNLYDLYDFDLQKGQTLDIFTSNWTLDTMKIKVDSLSTDMINGVSWENMWVSSDHTKGYFMYGQVIKGIGFIEYLFPRPGFVDPPPGGYLLCFKNNEIFYPSQYDCDKILPTIETSGEEILVYPNPTSNNIHTNFTEYESWQIWNTNGVQLDSGNSSKEISFRDQASGTYFLIFNEPNGGIKIQKIIRK